MKKRAIKSPIKIWSENKELLDSKECQGDAGGTKR